MVTETPVKQAVKPQETDLSWLLDAPRGTVVAIPDGSGWYCKGTDTVYVVTLSPVACECPWNTHKQAECFHIRCVREHVKKTDPCPVCHGNAHHTGNGSVTYTRGNGKVDGSALPRSCCGGTGTRQAWIEGGRVGIVRTSGLSEEERRELFR